MLEIIKYTFFQNALIAGIIIAIISGILGSFVVIKREANITHSIANFLFLGICVSLFLNGSYHLYAIIFAIVGSMLIFVLDSTNFLTRESSKEIVGQIGISLGIFIISFKSSLNLDINNFLFGSILFVSKADIYLIFGLLLIVLFLFFGFGKKYLSVVINEEIAKVNGLYINLYNFIYLLILALFVAFSIRIFGVLLISSFLILPTNIGKLIGKNLRQVYIYAISFSIISVILGLFTSYYLDSSASASIILVLIIFLIISFVVKKIEANIF